MMQSVYHCVDRGVKPRAKSTAKHRRPMPATFRLSSRRASGLAALAMALTSLSGCGVWQSLAVRDDNAPSVAVRVAVRPQAWAHDERRGPGFEFGLEQFRAHDVRQLATGETITIGSQNLLGPDPMGQVVTVRQAQVAYTHPFYFGDVFQLEPFVGLANVRVRYRAEPTNTALRPELVRSSTVVFGGITPRLRLSESADVEARLTLAPTLDVTDVYSRTLEVAAVLRPVSAVALRLGYAQRRVGVDFNVETNWTRLDIRANGPFATAQFEF